MDASVVLTLPFEDLRYLDLLRVFRLHVVSSLLGTRRGPGVEPNVWTDTQVWSEPW